MATFGWPCLWGLPVAFTSAGVDVRWRPHTCEARLRPARIVAVGRRSTGGPWALPAGRALVMIAPQSGASECSQRGSCTAIAKSRVLPELGAEGVGCLRQAGCVARCVAVRCLQGADCAPYPSLDLTPRPALGMCLAAVAGSLVTAWSGTVAPPAFGVLGS